MPQITFDMTDHDWERLHDLAFQWAGSSMSESPAYYENFTSLEAEKENRAPGTHWKWAYGVGDSWSNVMFAKAYLQSLGEGFEIVWDMTDHDDLKYLILCNLVPRGWHDEPAKSE